MDNRVVVVGASVAGWSAARALHAGGVPEVVLVGAEPHAPYDRPPLSKAYLAGDLDADGLSLLAPGDADAVTWRLGVPAVALRPDRTVVLADGTALAAGAVVVATGATARTLPAAAGLAGVHTLRTRDDADALRAALRPGVRVVVVGAGFVGSEVASTAHARGADVTVVDAAVQPMAAAFGTDLAAAVTGLHAAAGVPLHVGVGVRALHAADTEGGSPDAAGAARRDDDGAPRRVVGVTLTDGRRIPADVVVVGIGVRPETAWLAGSGVDLDDGVRIDAALRTSRPGVWACGDVARYPSARAGGPVRVEHWTHARDSGVAAARSVLGEPVAYDPVPYVWSEQYGVTVQCAGFVRPGDVAEVVEGDPARGRFVASYTRAGRPVAVVGMDGPRTFTRLRRALARA